MKKIKTFVIATMLIAISITAFASAIPNHCDDTNVVNIIGDAPHPFWGSVTVATYGYTDENGCLHTVNCVRKYRFWINFGTEPVESGIISCN